ncbi:hypothetical protein TCELL_0189 [Thermogladius calderae 1633]|uniref:Glycosyltransferase RgtA/B/C/D-like domain-containing protein n=1 Tax=Thermogladius calderae (strain DSM 22663 / VKM B-2946 / 1633) TaxID=1184251 RepID=I3TCX6_THEC1|nr:hypothetical protein [Thermogladius calderae]AFK50614.1 hypothetical protein TCELL_0189 [Thermogladius calderae 1633]
MVGIAIALTLASIKSLSALSIDVVTQSPFFLYGDPIYVLSLIAISLILVLLCYRDVFTETVVLILLLWFLVLDTPYIIYVSSMPLYNDQLGFVAEALSGLITGHVEPIQGEPSSLGHAYFTTVLTSVMGLKPFWGVVTVQSALPILYVTPLLALRRRTTWDLIIVALIVLGSMLNPILYGRTPFAWAYLVLFTVFLYNRLRGHDSRRGISVTSAVVILVVFLAYLISDPTSLMAPIMLMVVAVFGRGFLVTAIVALTTWFTVNLILYISGSMASLIMQLMAMLESPVNPVPSLVVPAVNPVMKIYNYVRELTVFLGFLLGLASSLVYLTHLARARQRSFNADARPWVLLYFLLAALQAMALVMSRWGMVPYTLYVLSALPVLVIMGMQGKWFRMFATVIGILLIALSPAVKWGFSPIAFPTVHDIAEASFIATHVSSNTAICASGVHELLWFYYWLYGVNAPITYLSPVITPSEVSACSYVAIFYRAMNTYRLDMSINQLMDEIDHLNTHFSIVYKDGIWGLWLR